MKVSSCRCLHGPNVWAACPVLELALDFSADGVADGELLQQMPDRFAAALPGWTPVPRAATDSPLAALARLFTHGVLHLQTEAGNPVAFAAVRATSRATTILAAIEFVEEPVGRAAVDVAAQLLEAARAGQSLPLEEERRRLQALAYDQRLPLSTAVVFHAARTRGIPAARLSPDYSRYLRLGQGSKQHRCRASEPDSVSAVARLASTDKELTRQLLQVAGVPVPEGRLVSSATDAWAAACQIGLPVAIKPQDADLGIGVSLDLRTRDRVEAAFQAAAAHSSEVLVERFAPGLEHRVLVVGEQVVAVTRVEPPCVVGDGVASVAELVARVNADPRRSDEDGPGPRYRMKLDAVAETALAAQGYTVASVLPAGARVLVRRDPPYFKYGGSFLDQTDRIHPATVAHSVAAAQALALPVAGLDVVAEDIAVPLEPQGGVVVEVNVSPGLWLHLAPYNDQPQPVGEAIVASLFAAEEDGRIPVVALLGDVTTAAREHLTRLLAAVGQRVGIAGQTETVVAGRRWVRSCRTPQERAGVVMQNPAVDVAVLETTPEELIDAGFGNDRCAVAVVLASALESATTAGDDLKPAPGEFLQALRHALTPGGALVLPAGTEASRAAGAGRSNIFLFGGAGGAAAAEHLAAGGRGLVVEGNQLMLHQGTGRPVCLAERAAGWAGADAEGVLAAVAAVLALGHAGEAVSASLRSLS